MNLKRGCRICESVQRIFNESAVMNSEVRLDKSPENKCEDWKPVT